MSMEIENYESIYKTIEENFNSKFFDFRYFEKKGYNKIDYYIVLKSYLSDKGYGYIASQINIFIEKNEIDDVEVTKLLMDCNLINKYNKEIKSSILNKSIIEYDKNNGLRESINIKYNTNIAFKIVNVVYSNIDLISHEINKSKKEVNININIDMNKRINFTEIISVYTPFGVDKLEFTVKCKNSTNKEIEIENIEEYLRMCRDNPYEAENVFNKRGFKNWIIEKDYRTQIINYEQVNALKNNSYSKFKIFCMLNGIYIDSEAEEIITKNIPQEIIVESIKDVSSKREEEIQDNINEKNHNIDANDINDANRESENIENKEDEEKGIFLGLKKKLGLIFKRK